MRRCRGTGLEGRVLPVRSVGVKADLRTYEQPVMLFGHAPHDTMMSIAAQIYGRVPGINRCVLDLSGRPPMRHAEPRAAGVTRARLDLLREADAIVMRAVERHGLMRAIWQFPTVMLPLAIDGRGEELIILRPVLSERGHDRAAGGAAAGAGRRHPRSDAVVARRLRPGSGPDDEAAGHDRVGIGSIRPAGP